MFATLKWQLFFNYAKPTHYTTFKSRFRKENYRTWAKWFIPGTKHLMGNKLQSLKHRLEYPRYLHWLAMVIFPYLSLAVSNITENGIKGFSRNYQYRLDTAQRIIYNILGMLRVYTSTIQRSENRFRHVNPKGMCIIGEPEIHSFCITKKLLREISVSRWWHAKPEHHGWAIGVRSQESGVVYSIVMLVHRHLN